MAFDSNNPLASFGVSLSGIQSGVVDIMYYVIWGIVGLAVGIFIYMKYQDKKVYIYPVRIFKQRHNGLVKEQNTMGGYVKKGLATTFSVKMTKWKKKNMDKLPVSDLMDEDNRIYYWQVSPDAPLIQVKRDFILEQILVPNDKFKEPTAEYKEEVVKKWTADLLNDEEFKDKTEEERRKQAEDLYATQLESERNKLVDITRPTYTPVATDLKQQAINDINNYKNTLGVDVNKQFAYFVIGVIAIVIIGGIIFYIAINKGDIPILTK